MIGRPRERLARWLTGSSPAMIHERWSAADRYICEQLIGPDPVLDAALAACDAAGLPPITVTANQGRLLQLLARMHGARRILELGTLGAYSTIWLARALPPSGRLVTLEADPHCAAVARANIAQAGLDDVVQLHEGLALETLPRLAREDAPFDFIFIDADKENYPAYLEWSLKLSRPGTVIIGDNVVGAGAIATDPQRDPWGETGGLRGVRHFYELLGKEPRVTATAVQTVGEKGHDGFALAIVNDA